MSAFLLASKLMTALVWLWAIAGAVGAAVPMAALGLPVVLILIAVHAVEVLVMLPRLRQAGGSLPVHVLGVLVFGLFHVLSLPQSS